MAKREKVEVGRIAQVSMLTTSMLQASPVEQPKEHQQHVFQNAGGKVFRVGYEAKQVDKSPRKGLVYYLQFIL